MANLRVTSRLQVGSAAWISQERGSALQIADSEAEEFIFSARNELDWLNEHMAEIFSENQINVTEIFKTPGKLRGKTPKTVRKRGAGQGRIPLSDVFSATPKGVPSPFRQAYQVDRQAPRFQVAEDPVEPPKPQAPVLKTTAIRGINKAFNDSGYHGSQSQASVITEVEERTNPLGMGKTNPMVMGAQNGQQSRSSDVSEERRTTEGSFQSAKEEQTTAVIHEDSTVQPEPILSKTEQDHSKQHSNKLPDQDPIVQSVISPSQSGGKLLSAAVMELQHKAELETEEQVAREDVLSPSEGSSPIIAPLVRKSSLTFASLPAREPLAAKQSIGNRTSRTSNLEQSRISYFGRSGGKSLVNVQLEDNENDDDEDAMDVDLIECDDEGRVESNNETRLAQMHNKTSTQRLQDQISMLGQSQSQAPRPSKSIPSLGALSSQLANAIPSQEPRRGASPLQSNRTLATPGAFQGDEEDSWIGPPNAAPAAPSIFSPRPGLDKSSTADVMEVAYVKNIAGGLDFNVPRQRRDDNVSGSPFREPAILDRTTGTLGHMKSASTSVLRSPTKESNSSEALLKKGVSVSNPSLASAVDNDAYLFEPKSPSRSFRDSPLKAAKDKVSSILKTSRNLFASSAAASAAAKGTLSPPPTRLGHYDAPSQEDVLQQSPLYPSLETLYQGQDSVRPDSPSKLFGMGKLGGSGEENKRKDKESKEIRDAQKREEKLEKLREKESAKARVFNQQEQERIAAMERQILAKKEQQQLAKSSQMDIPRATRSSPRKLKAQPEGEGTAAADATLQVSVTREVEMTDAPALVLADFSRPTVAAQIAHSREQAKRPVKPAKEPMGATKQAPVIIRVDTGSQRNPQRNLFHPSNVALSSSLQESFPPASSAARTAVPPPAIKNKANVASVRPKPSASSLKSVASNTGKVRALEAAAKKKELADQEALRKRNKQLEIDRKRAALQEEKQQEQRQQEAEKVRGKELDNAASQTEAKKHGQRTTEKRLEIERAKQHKPPPPAPRNQPATDLGQASLLDKPLPAVPPYRGELGQTRPASRMEATIHRPEEDFGRTASTLQNMNKAPPKRPLQQEPSEDSQSRTALQRNGPSNHPPEAKRRKTNEDHGEEVVDNHLKGHMAPPIRQSGTRQKDVPSKSIFSNGYANVPQPSHVAPSLHKAALTTQQMHRTKPAHPMDMAQTSKAPINFAPNPSQITATTHKTPARPGAVTQTGKSAGKPSARSSPRFQNGDSIELPEIPTDSEDEDDEDDAANNFPVPGWANSPALRQGLMIQEGMDPVHVFGLPGEIRLEEVFKNTDRHPRFRARTSSANWSGSDRLTEDEVRNDLEARDRLRKEGGWSYGLTNISRGQ